MSEPFIGEIIMFGGNFNPRGWQLCNGQLLSISQNTALFSILGTTFGGNGTSTFGLRDMRGRRPIHAGTGPGLANYTLGEQGGTENVTLLLNNLPAHSHSVNVNGGGANSDSPKGNVPAKTSSPVYSSAGPDGGSIMSPNMIGMTGGNIPVAILNPYLCVNFIIAVQGVFPSRN